MGLHLDERPDGGFALYIDGDFQFDTADEAIYHESLALPALCLARKNIQRGLRVLICGGGDGLALRECLRFPGVAAVDLVDYDPALVALARARFAEVNCQAFDDPRVHVHFADAWDFLDQHAPGAEGPQASLDLPTPLGLQSPPAGYDVILCDFTVPRTPEQTRIFTREWYERLSARLAPDGVIGLNAVSPETTPEAFWCLHQTVRAAGLSALPYRVCIPSFRAHGYGAWAFLLAAHHTLTARDLRTLDCPVETRQADITQLWRGARFRREERDMARRVPVHALDNDCLLGLLLNPGLRGSGEAPGGAVPFDLDPLLRAIPITHVYHTRTMIETLAEQVAATVEQIDIRRLVDALLRRAARLPADLRDELTRLRDFLRNTNLRWDRFVAWGARLFAALVIMMTIANAIAPDNAFAKGSAGLGHSGVSRGFSSSFGHASGSFAGSGRAGGSRGSFSGSRGSFGRSGAFGSHSIFESSASAPSIHGGGYRNGYGSGRPIDLYGDSYNVRPFSYYYGGTHSYFGSGRQDAPPSGPQQQHRPLFAADDDLLVMDNGDVIVTLSDRAYLLVTEGKVVLRSDQSPEPLAALYPDPAFFEGIIGQLRDRQAGVEQAVGVRRDWLSWVGWTSVLLPAVAQDKAELSHLQDLDRKLDSAIARLGQPPAGAAPLPPLPAGQVELFVDARLRQDGMAALRQADGIWLLTDGRSLTRDNPTDPRAQSMPCPSALAVALRSVIAKLQKEMTGDIAANEHDMQQIRSDRASLDRDLAEYTRLQAANGGDPNYQVDYGTDEIAVSDAIRRTQRDIDQSNRDMAEAQAEHAKLIADRQRLDLAAPALHP
jgi:spermidine synthase